MTWLSTHLCKFPSVSLPPHPSKDQQHRQDAAVPQLEEAVGKAGSFYLSIAAKGIRSSARGRRGCELSRL